MAVMLAHELRVERKPSLLPLPASTAGDSVRLTMTSIVISATVTVQPQQSALLDGAQLGFVQSNWVHRYWSRYEGPNVSDGSVLIDEVAPAAYNRIVYTDTTEKGQLFIGPPNEAFAAGIAPDSRGDYGALADLPASAMIDKSTQSSTIRLVMGDKTVCPVDTAMQNDLTGKKNLLAELFVQQEFYAALVVRERSGAATCLGFVHWWESYHYNETWNEPISAATKISHMPVSADTYIRVGPPTKGPPPDEAFLRALIVPSGISASEAGETSAWSAQPFQMRDASDNIPHPPPFGAFH